MILDTPVLDGVSISCADVDSDGRTDILVSDTFGHIWLYRNTTTRTIKTEQFFTLQYKVWAGTGVGFADGIAISLVDWEDDGDYDVVLGTEDGKLMLLRDPRVGRPTNLQAHAGVDSVRLEWDPNPQPTVSGYRVERALGAADFGWRAQTTLPTYLDMGMLPGNYSYSVSALSRFYRAGNSTPTVSRSPATEIHGVPVGGARFVWRDVVCKVGEFVEVMLSIENSLHFDVSGQVQVVSYDAEYLEPVKIVPSGLTEGIKYEHSFSNGQWTVSLIDGVLPSGSGKFFTLVFRTLKSGETNVGEAKVTISSTPTYQLGDVNGDGRINLLDLRLLAKLKSASGRKYNSDQLRAGDFNGNGKLDEADYQALRELLKKLGIL